MNDFTSDELMIVCMAREVRNGDLAIQGLTTPMAIIAYYLAKATHAPDASIMQLAGNILVHADYPPRVSILHNELRAMRNAVHLGSQTEVYEAIFKRARSVVEFFRPAQIDMRGNANNSLIERQGSRLRLPGGFGIPDVAAIYPRTLYYCPRHEKRVFVEHVDHVGGLGLNIIESAESRREIHVVSELGIFKVEPALARMMISNIHPGITLEQVKENTGFEMVVPETLPRTVPPTDLELELIREKIDPLNIRRLEVLAGEERKDALLDLLEKELASS